MSGWGRPMRKSTDARGGTKQKSSCYGIKEGDGMYLAPEDRVAIW